MHLNFLTGYLKLPSLYLHPVVLESIALWNMHLMYQVIQGQF